MKSFHDYLSAYRVATTEVATYIELDMEAPHPLPVLPNLLEENYTLRRVIKGTLMGAASPELGVHALRWGKARYGESSLFCLTGVESSIDVLFPLPSIEAKELYDWFQAGRKFMFKGRFWNGTSFE